MCGRYVRKADKQSIAEAFKIKGLPADLLLPPDFNVAPNTFQPVIRLNRDTGEREIVMMLWGLRPNFAKSASEFKGFSTINARAESLQERALWRRPFLMRRCIAYADIYYEWKMGTELAPDSAGPPKRPGPKTARSRAIKRGPKQPIAYSLSSGAPMGFAALWDAWKDPVTSEWLQSFAIITTTANELAAEAHDRMPVILHPKDYDLWLQRGEAADPDLQQQLMALLRPYEAEGMTANLANPAVGNVKNNGPEMLDAPPDPPPTFPPDPAEEQNSK